jgi:hypothetical protein
VEGEIVSPVLVFLLMLGGQPPVAAAQTPTSIVTVQDYNATGDGATDDTVAIVAAFSVVCAAGGGSIYFPAGTYLVNPAAASIPICSNLLVYGPGTLKVKPDAGNYRAIFAASPEHAPVNNLTFTGIAVDQNTFSNTAATLDVGNVATHQKIWQVWAGTNLHFENMRLHVSGVNSIDVNGPAISGVYVKGNYIVFQKRAGQPEFDNSAIYIDGDDFHVTDNTFVSTAADEARTAIEVHSGSGSVAGNTIDSFTIGMNLVNLTSSSVTGNNIRNAAFGISLWSTAVMDGVTISANTIAIAQVTRGTANSWGIATFHGEGINGDFSNLIVTGNVVVFEQESSSRAIIGSANYGIGLQALGNITNTMVFGNEIVRAPVRGIAIGILDGRFGTSRVSVAHNRIVDAGSTFSAGASWYSAAISMQGNLFSIDVVRNRLDFISSPFIGRYSYWSFENGYTFTNVVVAENNATAVEGAPTNGLTASVIQTYPPQGAIGPQ